MARDRQKIIDAAQSVLGKYVNEIRIIQDGMGHQVMVLFYLNKHKLKILQTFSWERLQAGKLPHQTYHIEVTDPKRRIITQKHYMTAKMVKMAILKTKKLDLLKHKKGVKTWA